MTRAAALLGLAILIAPATGLAQTGPALTPAQLAAERGGFQTPLGLDIGFGATVRTFVDGKVALQTSLTWTAGGAQVSSTGPAAAGTPGAFSLTIPGQGGSTEVVHDLGSDRISSLIVNTANNRDIRQQTDVTLTLPQLPQLQQQVAGDRIAASIQSALGIALRGSK